MFIGFKWDSLLGSGSGHYSRKWHLKDFHLLRLLKIVALDSGLSNLIVDETDEIRSIHATLYKQFVKGGPF